MNENVKRIIEDFFNHNVLNSIMSNEKFPSKQSEEPEFISNEIKKFGDSIKECKFYLNKDKVSGFVIFQTENNLVKIRIEENNWRELFVNSVIDIEPKS